MCELFLSANEIADVAHAIFNRDLVETGTLIDECVEIY